MPERKPGGGTTLGDSTWFEQGYWRSPHQTVGVPHPGQVFTDQSYANRQYVMPPDYTTNNCLLADATVPGGGTLTLSVPKTCTSLALLGTSGGGSGTVNYTVHHADSSTESGAVSFNDWFNGGSPSWTTGGRVGTPGGGEQDNGSNPRLYTGIVTTSSASPVTSIDLSYNGGGHVGVFAISTSTDDTTYTPVTVSGFNQRVIVPATFPLTATMDQGTNTVDNGNLATWFESGYIATNLTYGLPASGTIFSSVTQPTHHYQMGNYSANNAILIDAAHTVASIVPASPAPYNAFALLTAGGNIGTGNRMTNLCVMMHSDGVNETNTFYGYDWFEGTVPGFVAYNVNGRVNMHDRTVNALGSGNPKLFETYFGLSDTASPVTNIVLRFGSARSANATTFVMAVSATAGGIPPVVLDQPSRLNTYPGSTASFRFSLGAGTPPFTYSWQKAPSPDGPWTSVANGGNVSGATTTNLLLANVSAADAGYYRGLVANAVGSDTSSPPVALYLLTSHATNIALPADLVDDSMFGNAPPPNAGEGASNVVDHTTAKYLIYGTSGTGTAPYVGPSGFVLTPGVGNTIVSALRIYTANDAPERDPADIMLEGSSDGGASWTTLLADTALALPDYRNATGLPINVTNMVLQELDFANTTGYTSYRVTVNNVKTNSTAIGMQVAEIELLGVASGPPVVITPYSLPANAVAVLGTTATLPVGVAGTEPFTFQWTFNGANLADSSRISGAHSNVLAIANVQPGDAGDYRLYITNSAGFYNVYPNGGADQSLLVITNTTFLTNGLGWQLNANPAPTAPLIDSDTLTIAAGASGSRSAFFQTPLPVSAFKASFTYQDVGGGGADGFAFLLQNDPRGTTALGGGGGALAISGITPSVAWTFNIYSGSPGGVGIAFGTNGNNGAPYASTAPVDISNGNPINVNITYYNGVAGITLTDTVTSDTFTTNITVGNVPAMVGGPTAYVGFAGAVGGITSIQTISSFVYEPLTSLAATKSGSQLLLTWPVLPAGYVLQSKPSLTSGTWQDVNQTVSQLNGQNQVTVPITDMQFYRLVLR